MSIIQPGMKFGLLTVIRQSDRRIGRRIPWVCACDCGGETLAISSKLVAGHNKSCGCLRKTGSHLHRMTQKAVAANTRTLVGQRFGRLLIVSETPKEATCHCDCGNVITKPRVNIGRVGSGSSCGCLVREHAKNLQRDRTRRHRIACGGDPDTPISPANKMIRNDMRMIKQSTMKRDGFRCALCGLAGVKFHVHHIRPFAKNTALRLDPTNLVTLCVSCHIGVAHGGNVHAEPSPVVAAILTAYVNGSHDRDVNAARNILVLARSATGPVEESRRAA
jgi:5-methylcytosine-specific restriction endonuclease McrA